MTDVQVRLYRTRWLLVALGVIVVVALGVSKLLH
jgi:hypothetical protein